MLKPVLCCDYCELSKHAKNSMPCSTCSCNKDYISHFKLDPAIQKLVDEKIIYRLKEDRDGKHFYIGNAGVCGRYVPGSGMEVQSEESDESESDHSDLCGGSTDGKDRYNSFSETDGTDSAKLERNDSISATKSFS